MNSDQLRSQVYQWCLCIIEAVAQEIMKQLSRRPLCVRMLQGVRERIELLPDDSLRRQSWIGEILSARWQQSARAVLVKSCINY